MNDIEEIKSRIDIRDIVGQYVTLKKAGANFKGLCPFHHERTSSFMVNPERQIFKCFGCNKGGDIFTFIQDIEHIEFGDALRMLADKAGVTLQERTKPAAGEAPSEKSRYYAINSLADQLFHKLLIDHPVGKAAREYLNNRGITQTTIQRWRIGYAPRKKILTDFLVKRGFNFDEIQRAGKPDMFYDRIMFPIMDVMGNTVGYTGRILGQGEPKYLNTPESPIFHKSRIIFGLEKAKKAIKETGSVILTEGQMDVISAHQAGTENVVATSGTALTQDHLRILARYDVDIIFAFDTDSAGMKATKKAIDMAVSDGLSVKVIPLPKPYKDIGEVVEKDPKLWLEIAKKPIAAIEWQISSVFNQYHHKGIERKLSVDEKKKVAKELIPVLTDIPDFIEQAHYIQLLAKRLEVKEDTIQQAMKRYRPHQTISPAPNSEKTSSSQTKAKHTLSTEEALLGLLELYKDRQAGRENLYNELKTMYNQPINDLLFLVQEQYRGLAPAEVKEEIELLIGRYDEHKKDRLKADFAAKISDAESRGDRAAVKKLLTDFQDLIK